MFYCSCNRDIREELCILASCCLSPMRRNSVLEELRVSRLAVIQEAICCKTVVSGLDCIGNQVGGKTERSVCHLHRGGDPRNGMI